MSFWAAAGDAQVNARAASMIAVADQGGLVLVKTQPGTVQSDVTAGGGQ